MKPDRQSPPGYLVEHRHKTRMIERRAAHMRAKLEANCAHRVGPADLGKRRIDIVQRQGGGEGGETIGMPYDQLGETVIHQSHHIDRDRSVGQILDGRHRRRQQLSIAGKAIHQPKPMVEIVKRLQLQPSPQRTRRRRHGLQSREIGLRKDVSPGVDKFGQSTLLRVKNDGMNQGDSVSSDFPAVSIAKSLVTTAPSASTQPKTANTQLMPNTTET